MQANVDMAMQPDGQTALHIAAEQAKIDTAMLEVNNGNLIIWAEKTQIRKKSDNDDYSNS